ncbi:ABC transporter permease [Pollutibacter soli]|uniref:ABC transporter permease n=1 Tax=Pollutibacter soli TaxID=3034157 RepID=UPI0030139AAE
MLINYLKLAWRNLVKYPAISFINLFGLTAGVTCCLLILAYILFELSYDRKPENADRIYRVTRSFNNSEGIQSLNLATVSPPFGHYLPSDFPEIEKMTRLLSTGDIVFKYGEKLITEHDVYFADSNFTEMFNVKVLKGNPKTALAEPFAIMMTSETARKYFGDEDPMNKIVRVNNQFDAKIAGIYEPLPSNTHLHPGTLVSFNTLKDDNVYGEEALRTNWGNNSFFTYIQLPVNYKPETMEARFPAFLDKQMVNQYGTNKPSKFTKLKLQKLTDIHLRSHTDYEAEVNGDINRVYIFSAVALFILLIACINYMNLSTARSALRAREIGIRKVVGAGKKTLIGQFLTESVMMVWLAIILSMVAVYFLLPSMGKLLGQEIDRSVLLNSRVITGLIIAPFIIGIISGIYPALFLSSFQPVKTLKGLFKTDGSNISLRKALVVSQFSISIILIITTLVVAQQLKFLQKTKLGYDKDQVVTLVYPNSMGTTYDAFRNDLLQNPAIKNAGRSSRIPTGRLLDSQGSSAIVGDSLVPVTAVLKNVAADYDFIPTYGIKMAAGRNFSREFGTDTSAFILNQASVRALGWKDDNSAIGKNFAYGVTRGKIIGVMEDFHFESLHQQIAPMILLLPASSGPGYNYISVKLTGNIPDALAHLEKKWIQYTPEFPYQFNFVNDDYNNLYQAEQRQGKIFTIFACIAIFIACLGLFGLSAFSITQRVKEIGVRKVLGANTSSIVTLLSKDFLKLVAIAAVIAFPVAGYFMYNWLQDFAYRTSLQWWIFVLAGIIAGLIALGTISFQAIKAAWRNPVSSLRSE